VPCVEIEADRFLYKMVRTIVGTLIDIGREKITLPLQEIIAKGEPQTGRRDCARVRIGAGQRGI